MKKPQIKIYKEYFYNKIQMKNLTLILILISLHSNLFSQNNLQDKNARKIYSYILDSLNNLKSYNPQNKITIKKYTNDFQFLKRKDFGTLNNEFNTCFTSIYSSLQGKYPIDSIEFFNIKNYKFKLTNLDIDTTKYTLIEDDSKSEISLSEPLYFYKKNFVIVSVMFFNSNEAIYVLKKKKKGWELFGTFCEEMY